MAIEDYVVGCTKSGRKGYKNLSEFYLIEVLEAKEQIDFEECEKQGIDINSIKANDKNTKIPRKYNGKVLPSKVAHNFFTYNKILRARVPATAYRSITITSEDNIIQDDNGNYTIRTLASHMLGEFSSIISLIDYDKCKELGIDINNIKARDNKTDIPTKCDKNGHNPKLRKAREFFYPRGSGGYGIINCEFCNGREVCYEDSIAYCLPELFEKRPDGTWKCWSEKNSTTPDKISCRNTHDKYIFICPTCGSDILTNARDFIIAMNNSGTCKNCRYYANNKAIDKYPEKCKQIQECIDLNEWKNNPNPYSEYNENIINECSAFSNKIVPIRCTRCNIIRIVPIYALLRSCNPYLCEKCSRVSIEDIEDEVIKSSKGNKTLVRYIHGSKNISPRLLLLCNIHKVEYSQNLYEFRSNHEGCPLCGQRWTIERMRHFIKSLIPCLPNMPQDILRIILNQDGALTSQGVCSSIAKAILLRKFSTEELEKFADGEQSEVDSFIGSDIDLDEEINKQLIDVDPSSDFINNLSVDSFIKNLEYLNDNTNIASSPDKEALEYIISRLCEGSWKVAFLNENNSAETIRLVNKLNNCNGVIGKLVRDRFFEEYGQVTSLGIPADYSFIPKGFEGISPPNLMQKYTVYKVLTKGKVGNWSDIGSGKTLSAILSSIAIDSRLTVILCPNSVVDVWESNILNAFPNSQVCKSFNCEWNNGSSGKRYLVLNYEKFQQDNSTVMVNNLVENNEIDFVVADEIQLTKHRYKNSQESNRRQTILYMLNLINSKNEKSSRLFMSATPIINNLQEAKSIIEALTGKEHKDLQTRTTISNCMKIRQKLMEHGFRFKSHIDIKYEQTILDIDGSEHYDSIKQCGTVLELEQMLTRLKIPTILESLKQKTVIYTHSIGNTSKDSTRIDKMIIDAIESNTEFKIGLYTGDDKINPDDFIGGDVDILIVSSCISAGFDGLQEVCDRMIINSLPWTSADFDQIKGRIFRTGQKASKVEVIIPAVVVNGAQFWDDMKLRRINNKRSVSDFVLDGTMPEGCLVTQEQALKHLMGWLERINNGNINEIVRDKIVSVVNIPSGKVRKPRKEGGFTRLSRRLETTSSTNMEKYAQENPDDFVDYGNERENMEKNWPIVPHERIANDLKKMGDGLFIGDFGSGPAKISEQLSGKHTVRSFDLHPYNDRVTPCNMLAVPLQNEELDVAIFSLSLKGLKKDKADYIIEANRVLKVGGLLYIAHPSNRLRDNIHKFKDDLNNLGFKIIEIDNTGTFTFIVAEKVSDPESIKIKLQI